MFYRWAENINLKLSGIAFKNLKNAKKQLFFHILNNINIFLDDILPVWNTDKLNAGHFKTEMRLTRRKRNFHFYAHHRSILFRPAQRRSMRCTSSLCQLHDSLSKDAPLIITNIPGHALYSHGNINSQCTLGLGLINVEAGALVIFVKIGY